MVKNEGDVQIGGFPPYPVSYRSLIPKKEECTNLLVPVCLSASHIAYGSIRMEPVFMVMGQSSAVAAVLAIDRKISVQAVDINRVQQILKSNPLADGSVSEVLVDNDNKFVQTKGNWTRDTRGCFGPSMFVDDSKGKEEKYVRFLPTIYKSGNYHVYMYLPKLQDAASKISINVYDGSKITSQVIETSAIKIQGQTSGEWVDLKTYSLKQNTKPYVEISNKAADGKIVADAILFVPVRE